MTRSTASRRARNSDSVMIGGLRRPDSRPSRRRCRLASSRVDPLTPGRRRRRRRGRAGVAHVHDGVRRVVGALRVAVARRTRCGACACGAGPRSRARPRRLRPRRPRPPRPRIRPPRPPSDAPRADLAGRSPCRTWLCRTWPCRTGRGRRLGRAGLGRVVAGWPRLPRPRPSRRRPRPLPRPPRRLRFAPPVAASPSPSRRLAAAAGASSASSAGARPACARRWLAMSGGWKITSGGWNGGRRRRLGAPGSRGGTTGARRRTPASRPARRGASATVGAAAYGTARAATLAGRGPSGCPPGLARWPGASARAAPAGRVTAAGARAGPAAAALATGLRPRRPSGSPVAGGLWRGAGRRLPRRSGRHRPAHRGLVPCRQARCRASGQSPVRLPGARAGIRPLRAARELFVSAGWRGARSSQRRPLPASEFLFPVLAPRHGRAARAPARSPLAVRAQAARGHPAAVPP